MKRISLALVALLAFATMPSAVEAAQRGPGYRGGDSSFKIQLGQFEPRGDSRYWAENEADFTGDADDFEDAAVGLTYQRPLGPRMAFELSGFFFEATEDLAYRDFEDASGRDIFHTTELETAAVTAGLVFNLTPPDASVIPYVGVGGGIYSYRLTEFGDFIDFSGAELEIFDDFFEVEDEELGWYLKAGLEVPLAHTWSIFAEGRWDKAEADLEGDFAGLGDLDLSGKSYSAGVSFRF